MLPRLGLRRARRPTADACGQLLARAHIARQRCGFHTGWHDNGMAGTALLQTQPQGSKRQRGRSCSGRANYETCVAPLALLLRSRVDRL